MPRCALSAGEEPVGAPGHHKAGPDAQPRQGQSWAALGLPGWGCRTLPLVRLPELSPSAYRRVTLAALWSLVFIVVTGAAVRLSNSGLGCTDWPTCKANRVVAPFEYHAMVEFVNRTITGLVSVAVILAVLGSLRRVPRRRDLTWLSVGLVAGVVGQIVLGGMVVKFDLNPWLVQGHFVLSMLLVLDAAVLAHRAGLDDASASGPAPRRAEHPAYRHGVGGPRGHRDPDRHGDHGRWAAFGPERRRVRSPVANRPARRGAHPRRRHDAVPGRDRRARRPDASLRR